VWVSTFGIFALCNQDNLVALLVELGSDHHPTLSPQQRSKLDNAMALVNKTLMPLSCNVYLALSLWCHGLAHVYMFHAIGVQGCSMIWASSRPSWK
jgi:hypothetical protein